MAPAGRMRIEARTSVRDLEGRVVVERGWLVLSLALFEAVLLAFLFEVLVVAMHLSKVLVFKATDGVLKEVVDRDDGLIGQIRQVQNDGIVIIHG
jgi:hypothetical protein